MEEEMKPLDWLIIAICAVLFAGLTVKTKTAHAHDPQTHLVNGLSEARSKANSLCCDGSDYTYVNPRSWERTDKGFRVYVHDQWVTVPAEAEVGNMRNPDGEAKAWLYLDEGVWHVRCFMVGIES